MGAILNRREYIADEGNCGSKRREGLSDSM